jgi:hypothetical protein
MVDCIRVASSGAAPTRRVLTMPDRSKESVSEHYRRLAPPWRRQALVGQRDGEGDLVADVGRRVAHRFGHRQVGHVVTS